MLQKVRTKNGGGGRAKYHNIIIILLAVLSILSVQTFADIQEVVELVRESHLIQWENLGGEKVTFGEEDSALGVAKESFRPTRNWSPVTGAYYTDYLKDKVIEVQPKPTMGRGNTSIRGVYKTKLPDMKRVQLELTYDVEAVDAETAGIMDFHIEVQEKKGDKDAETWNKTGEFHNRGYAARSKSSDVITYKDNSFTTHNFTVNLSEWRGKEVRLIMVSELPKSVVTPQKGYWRLVRLVAFSFDFIFDLTPEEFNALNNQPKASAKTSGRNARTATTIQSITEYTVGPLQEVPLNHKPGDPNFGVGDLFNVPDVGLTSASINSKEFAYFSGRRQLSGSTERGTFGFRFNGSATLSSAATTTLQNDLYRVDNLPFKFLYPMATGSESFDNYLGVSTTCIGTINGTQTMHAFWQAEDNRNAAGIEYKDIFDIGFAYGRIGYARSTDGVNFTRMHDSSGSIVANATPIITHWQSEEICANYVIGEPTPYGVNGTAPPSVIEQGDYYYMFYTRFMDYRVINKYLQGQWVFDYQKDYSPFWGWPAYISVIPYGTNEYFKGNICVARALKSSVNVSQNTYEANPNPWKKFYRKPYQPIGGQWAYQETWTEPGAAGFDTAILPTRGVYCKVSWNFYFQRYIMITYHNGGYFLLFQSNGNDLTSWTYGGRITEIEENNVWTVYPSLFGVAGKDYLTSQYNMLYYARQDVNHPTGSHYMVRRSLIFD